MKECFKCLTVKSLSEFYKHPGMADGHLNKCKECTKADSNKHRAENLERVQEYDRSRGNLPHRVAAREAYAETERGKAALLRAKSSYRQRNPIRAAANNAVSKAVRSGKLKKLPCIVCGAEKVEGHHPVYSLPLDVVWLCKEHHQQLHNEHDELIRSINQAH